MSDDSKFKCASCGKEYRWKPELAGKRAKCKCGAAIQVPATDPARRPTGPAKAAVPGPPPPPVEAEPSFDDVYAVAAAEAEQAAEINQANAPPAGAAPSKPPPAPPQGLGSAYAGSIPHRAKIDHTSPMETYHNRWRGLGWALGGLLLCAYGYFEFHTLARLEHRGGYHRMRVWVSVLYSVGGKWAVLVVLGGMGVLVFLVGVLALFGKAHIEGDD